MHYRAKMLEASSEQRDRISVIRSSFSKMYEVIDINCKKGRETELAIARLEEAQSWAIKGITRED